MDIWALGSSTNVLLFVPFGPLQSYLWVGLIWINWDSYFNDFARFYKWALWLGWWLDQFWWKGHTMCANHIQTYELQITNKLSAIVCQTVETWDWLKANALFNKLVWNDICMIISLLCEWNNITFIPNFITQWLICGCYSPSDKVLEFVHTINAPIYHTIVLLPQFKK